MWIPIRLKHLLSSCSLNLKAPFCTSTFTLNSKWLFECTHSRKIVPLPYKYFVHIVPQIIPLLTLTLVRTCYKESNPQGYCLAHMADFGGISDQDQMLAYFGDYFTSTITCNRTPLEDRQWNGEERPLVTCEPVEFEKKPVEVLDFGKISNHLRAIFGIQFT